MPAIRVATPSEVPDAMSQRFVILSSPRSGTHMLRTTLNAHSHLVCRAESFNPDLIAGERYDETWSTQEILEQHLFGDPRDSVQAAGFAIHRGGAPLGPWTDIWSLLEGDRSLHLIFLHRHDLLRRYLSFVVMRERNRCGSPQFEPAPRKIEAEVLRQEFLRYESELVAFRKRFEAHRLFQVSYEELCNAFHPTSLRLQRFLNVPIERLAPKTRKNPHRPPRFLLENFDELQAEFSGSRWAWFFDEWPRR